MNLSPTEPQSTPPRGAPAPSKALTLRRPRAEDGADMWTLAKEGGGLDLNTPYAYLLLSTHFASTSLVALRGDRVVAFVAAYRPPTDPQAIFVWQIGVDTSLRGQGVASRLLDALFTEEGDAGMRADVRFLEATITPSNQASRRLFRSFAERHGVPCAVRPHFREAHFPGQADHEAEDLYRIGPIRRAL